MQRALLLFALVVLITGSVAPASGQDGFVAPGDNMALEGIPPIPQAVAANVDRYVQYRSAAFARWHPERLEMLITTRFADTAQVHRVVAPGAAREQATFLDEPVSGVSAYVAGGESRDFFTFRQDTGGDEFFQIYRYDIESGRTTLLTDGAKRHNGGVRSEVTGLLAFQRQDADADGAFSEVRVVDPEAPDSERIVAKYFGGAWLPLDWSPDGRQLLIREYISINESRIWLLDVDSGASRRLLPAESDQPVAHGQARFSQDGRGIYVDSDTGTEFRKLTYVDLDTLDRVVLSDHIDWDVERFDLSKDGEWVAYSVNQAGQSVLHVLNTRTRQSTRVEGVPRGVLNALQWHNDSEHLAFSLASASVPGDVFVWDTSSGEVVRWTKSETGGIDAETFPEAELVEWTSFDGMAISGFLYRPPARFTGRRPVIVRIHGGPEGQSRPGLTAAASTQWSGLV